MTYYEIVEENFRNRNNIVPVTNVSMEPRDHQAYISMFGYGEEIQNWVKINDTVKGYNDIFYARTLYFDIDRDNLDAARRDTLELLKHLYNNFGINPEHLVLFFSGGKGFHVGIPDQLFGGFPPSADLPAQINKLAHKLSSEDIEGVDLTIYNPNRLFRMPQSKHQDTGLFKVPLTLDEVRKPIADIKELAEYPRPEFKLQVNYNDLIVNSTLRDIWEQCQHQTESGETNTPKDSLREDSFFQPPSEGGRNNKLFKQAAMLFDKGLDSRHVYSIIESINSAASPPIDDENEIYTIVQSAKRKTGAKREKKVERSANSLVSDMVPSYLEYLSPSRRKLGLLFDSFSEDVRYKLRGKLIGVVGREGTKKSIYCQNVAYANMRKHGARTIISNMEMGNNPLMSRLIDRTFSNYKIRPSDDMEMAMEEGKESWVKERLHLLAKHFNNKFIVNSQSAMTPGDYKLLIESTEESYGKVDMLIVDGFSMMGGGSSDRFQNQEKNSRELKEIAKDKDVCVMAIFHTNASAEKYWRSAHEYIRGTNKQKDNVDAFISLSLLVDKQKTQNPNDIYYRDDKGYALMYNKRGSGNTLRSIYDFDSAQLKLIESGDKPEQYEVDVNKI